MDTAHLINFFFAYIYSGKWLRKGVNIENLNKNYSILSSFFVENEDG